MTVAEANTINMLNTLSTPELFRVEEKVQELIATRRREKYLPKMSGDEIISALENSYQQSLRGETYSEEVARREIRGIVGI